MTTAVEAWSFNTLIGSNAVAIIMSIVQSSERSISAEETQLKCQERRGWAIHK